jgi:hypothetical protein
VVESGIVGDGSAAFRALVREEIDAPSATATPGTSQ